MKLLRAIARIFTPKTKKGAGAEGAIAGALITATAAFVGPWEGRETTAYLDRIASPPVWTVCHGETRGVRQGDTYTVEECDKMLEAALIEFRDGLYRCIPDLVNQPQGVQVSLISWSYNVGTGAACGSTLARRANAGDWAAACDQLPRWNRAGGREVPGLTNRRRDEHALCRGALEDA